MKPKTWAHPKFALLQRRLGICPALAAGILEGIWHLAATFDPEHGTLPHSGDEMAAWLGVEIDGPELLDALIATDWLDEGMGMPAIHNWQEHKPGYIKEAERKRRQRVPVVPGLSRDIDRRSRDNPVVADHSDSDSEKKKSRRNTFVPPSAEEVTEYSQSIGYPLDGQAWCDCYEQKGWKVGKAKVAMKSWQAAVRTWKANGYRFNGQTAVMVDQGKADSDDAFRQRDAKRKAAENGQS